MRMVEAPTLFDLWFEFAACVVILNILRWIQVIPEDDLFMIFVVCVGCFVNEVLWFIKGLLSERGCAVNE